MIISLGPASTCKKQYATGTHPFFLLLFCWCSRAILARGGRLLLRGWTTWPHNRHISYDTTLC